MEKQKVILEDSRLNEYLGLRIDGPILTQITLNDDIINYIQQELEFGMDYWDFSKFDKANSINNRLIFNFKKIDRNYIVFLKQYIVRRIIIYRVKICTVKTEFSFIKKFVSFLSENNIYYYESIDLKVVQAFIEKNFEGNMPKTKKIKISNIKSFLNLMEEINENISYAKIYKYMESIVSKEEIRLETESNKFKLIPEMIFKKILSLAILDVKDENLCIFRRLTAAMIVFLAETGIRIGEFRLIEIGNLHKEMLDLNKIYTYLDFKTFKGASADEGFKWTYTSLSDKAEMAYNYIIELTQKFRAKKSATTLYLSKYGERYYDETAFGSQIIKFMIIHRIELDCINSKSEEVKKLNSKCIKNMFKSRIKSKAICEQFKDNDVLYYITPHQFRVNLCNSLYKKNVHIFYIQKHMNHIYEDTTAYYIRSESYKEKDIYAKRVIEKIVVFSQINEGKFEGIPESIVEEMQEDLKDNVILNKYKKIESFLKSNKIYIEKNTDSLLKMMLENENSVLELEEGFCCRNEFMSLCARQEFLNSNSKYNSISIYIPTIDFVDSTYNRFHDKLKVIKHNKELVDQGLPYQIELSRETTAIRKLVSKCLVPEFMLIKSFIGNKGSTEFERRYPHLTNLAKDIDNITQKELSEWI